MLIAGSTGGIGSQLLKHFGAMPYDPRKDPYFDGHDVLINCMGISVNGMGHKLNHSHFREVIEVNLIDAYGITHLALQDMRSRGYGRIIHLSSMLSTETIVGTSAYSASKAGLNAMVRVLGKENREKNVLINSLNLGYIDTGMTHEIGLRGASINEVINACEMLIKSDFITGQNINIW